ncbi:MAG: hypothetical protein M0R46_08325 [Candidatus Muirbacterium halophilum]|nr:hypothetical protein [Candidatus Muirbacterium halophilum]MCK9475909.1 hypothetical protein [Candidatus Muirbacterium halophilum]
MSLFILALISIIVVVVIAYFIFFIFTYEKKDKNMEIEKTISKKNISSELYNTKDMSYSVDKKFKSRESALKKMEEENTIPPIYAGKSKKNSKEEKYLRKIADNNPKLLAQIFKDVLEEDPEWKFLKKNLK